MKLTVYRRPTDHGATIGELYLNGKYQCYTLEDTVRDGEKVPGDTAIPAGTYAVTITMSPHFGRRLPLLLGVPNFEGVRIHPGNTPADTEGCILVGTMAMTAQLLNSRAAFDPLFNVMEKAFLAGEDIFIEVINGQQA